MQINFRENFSLRIDVIIRVTIILLLFLQFKNYQMNLLNRIRFVRGRLIAVVPNSTQIEGHFENFLPPWITIGFHFFLLFPKMLNNNYKP